jgi:hypothetical protein
LTGVLAQLVELAGDDGDRTCVQTHDGAHGHQRIRLGANNAGVALALLDVALDGVEDGDELALTIRAEP